MGKYLVFDEETETHTKYKRKASAFVQENWIVMRGWKKQGDAQCSYTYHPTHDRTSTLQIDDDVDLLIGFNLKFDLMWEMAQGNEQLAAFFKRGGKIWCCQYAEYLIMGQAEEAQMCSLDSIVEKYGGRKKIDEVKILWQAGVLTSQIQEDLLVDYLIGTEEEGRNSGDIGNTEKCFLGQITKAVQQGQLKMIQDRMDGLLCTTEMEYRGLKVDVAEAARRLQVLQADLKAQNDELDSYLPANLPFEFNWGSGIHASCYIFGGTVKYEQSATYIDEETGQLARLKATADWPLVLGTAMEPAAFAISGCLQDTFLSGAKKGELKFRKVPVQGELKTKIQPFYYSFEGVTNPDKSWTLKNTDGKGGPLYGTGKDIMVELFTRDIPFLKAMSRKTALDKEIGTYYVKADKKGKLSGMLTCVQREDHMLHHNLNHTITVTTRLSSSEPNLQNVPQTNKSEVKKMFVSRFGADGCMIEADYSQLEVVVQGVLSKDPQLCADLRNKIDFHCKRVSAKFGCTYEEALFWCKKEAAPDHVMWKNRRTGVKEFSFQRAYGAGAAAIAFATGMPINDVKELIVAEEIMYPGVIRFNAEVENEVLRSAVPFQTVNTDTGEWKTYRRGYYTVPTGTRYSFRTWNAPDFMLKRGVDNTFSPPELKNYPVQGTGGEFVQCVLGLLWRHFIACDNYGGKAFLVNTVHDCVWIDCHRSVRDQVCADIKRIMESIPAFYNTRHGMDIDVPFPVEVEYGPNMFDLHHWQEPERLAA
jgi:DNA polymerase I-like protein with 3'-5' exonuclease and polymerase domains